MTDRISNDDLRRVISGAYVFVEPQDAGLTFRSVCEELLAARATPPAAVCVASDAAIYSLVRRIRELGGECSRCGDCFHVLEECPL